MPHETFQRAQTQYDAAFHLLNVTFPLVKDPKLLLGVINNLNKALESGVEAVLKHEQQRKLVPNFQNDFQSKFNLFRYKSVKRNNIATKHIMMMMELRELEELHKQCPTAFQRGNKYVLANEKYQLKVISMNDLKQYVSTTKEFMDHIQKIVNLNRKE